MEHKVSAGEFKQRLKDLVDLLDDAWDMAKDLYRDVDGYMEDGFSIDYDVEGKKGFELSVYNSLIEMENFRDRGVGEVESLIDVVGELYDRI